MHSRCAVRENCTVRCTLAFTPTWTTARPGGFTPAGSGPDTSCRQKILEPVWKGGPSDGAVDRLLGIFWPNMLDRSRARRRVTHRDSSRNENRGALPKVPSIISTPICVWALMPFLPTAPATHFDQGDVRCRLDPSHHSPPIVLLENRTDTDLWGPQHPR